MPFCGRPGMGELEGEGDGLMPDPLASDLMHLLGQNHAAKWLFAQVVAVCRAQRRRVGQPRLITRARLEELCRAHQVPAEALGALVGAVDDVGGHVFLEPWPGEPDTFRLPELWCDSSSKERVARHRLKLVDAGHKSGRQVAEDAMRDLAGAANSNFVTVTKFEPGEPTGDAGALALFADGQAPATRWVRGEPPAAVVRGIYDLWWEAFKRENPTARHRNLTPDRSKAITTALRKLSTGGGQEGRDEAVRICQDAVRGWVHDTFGERHRFSDLKWVLRAGNVEAFADWHNGVNLPRATVAVPRETPGSRAAASAAKKRAVAEGLRRQAGAAQA